MGVFHHRGYRRVIRGRDSRSTRDALIDHKRDIMFQDKIDSRPLFRSFYYGTTLRHVQDYITVLSTGFDA